MESGLIFDMDGVIIDSNPYHKIAWRNYLDKKGIQLTDDLFDTLISGKTGETSLKSLLGKELSEGKIREILEEIDGGFRSILRNTSTLHSIPGVSSFIRAAKREGHKIALATSAPTGNVDLTLEKLDFEGLFDVVIDKTFVQQGKPHPEVYLKTLATLKMNPAQCVVFEDSISGIRAAKSADLRVVGLTTGHSREELFREGVILAIDDFSEIQPQEILNLSI